MISINSSNAQLRVPQHSINNNLIILIAVSRPTCTSYVRVTMVLCTLLHGMVRIHDHGHMGSNGCMCLVSDDIAWLQNLYAYGSWMKLDPVVQCQMNDSSDHGLPDE